MIDHGKRLADAADREKAAADLAHSYIVEAAAGTGKTTLLVERILNLIKTARAQPEEIVAITFTERAAAELKAKLQDRLGQETAAASGKQADTLAEALHGLDRMQVTTIHAFCTAILKERPVEAGVDPNFGVADELMASLISQDTWDEWIARKMEGNDPVLRRALTLGIAPDKMLDNMHALAMTISENRDIAGLLPEVEASGRGTDAFVENLGGAAGGLDEAAGACRNPDDAACRLIQRLAGYAKDLESMKGEDAIETYITSMSMPKVGRLGNAANWASKKHLAEVREGLGALKQELERTRSTIVHNVIASVCNLLLEYVDCYTDAKASQGLLDFHDLLLCTRDLLRQHDHVRDYFGSRFRYILVDEFQDTDPLQAEIVFYLAGASPGRTGQWRESKTNPGRLFLVGDPKQSIYRFRRADIEMYADAKRTLGKDRHLSIHQNFRCSESIVRAVNSIFEDLIKVPEEGDYQPEYVALDFGRMPETQPAGRGVVLLYPPEEIADGMGAVDMRRLYEARSIAATIRHVVEKRWETWDKAKECLRPVGLKDIAILMRTQTGLEALEDALRLYNIDYRVIGGKRFFMCEEIQQLRATLMAIDNPNDKVALVAALRSPFFGISDEAMVTFHAEGGDFDYLDDAVGTPLAQAFGLLRRLHLARNRLSPESLLDTLLAETKATVLFVLRPNGEQRVANLLKIGDMARALVDRGVLTFRAFVRWLAERSEEEAEEAEAATVETGDDFVRLLTIHKAKGLEFPVVILADLAAMPNQVETFVVDRRKNEIAIRIGSKESGIQTLNYERLCEYEDLRREAEERRLLYVAMTRARDFVVIPSYFATPRELPKPDDTTPKSLFHYLAPRIPLPGDIGSTKPPEGTRILDSAPLDLEPGEPLTFRIPLDPDAPEPAEVDAVCDRLERWKSEQAARIEWAMRGRGLKSATEEKEVLPVGGRSQGVLFGRLVHRLFERTAWEQPALLEETAAAEAKALGADAAMAGKAAKMVRRALESDLMKRIIRADRYFKEVPFAFRERDDLVEGVIDVLFEEGGRIGIVDFKTDRVPKRKIAPKVEEYRTQVETYRRAVSAACGKPPEEAILFFLHPMEVVTIPIR